MATELLEEVSEELKTVEEPSEPERNRGGRPPGAKNKGPSPSFFDRLKDIDWQRHTAFIYRLQPLIDRTVGGEPKYIDKYGEPFDEDRVMHDHGSGVYQVRLTELQGKTGKSTQVDSYNFEIYNMKFPPQCPVGVWLDDHRNERWKWAKEPLTAEQAGKPVDNRSNGVGGQDVGSLVKTIGKELRDGQVDPTKQFEAQTAAYQTGLKQGIETAKASTPAGGDSKLIETILTALLNRPEPKGDDSVVKVLTLQLEAEREQRKADREQAKADREAADKRADAAEKRHNDLMQVMLAKKENSGTDVIQQFTSMFNMFKGITEGGLGATDDSWTGILKEGVREALPHIAPSLAPMIGGMVTGAAQFAGGGPRPAPGPQRVPPPAPHGSQVASSIAEPPPQQDPHMGAYQCVFMNQAALLNAVKSGKPGIEFGDWLVEGHGPLEIEKLKAAGVDRIVAFISQQVPAMWAELQPFEMKFRAFLSELMSWTPADEEEDQPADPPTDPAAEPVFPGKAKSKKKGAN
jgi:hypothetical protein